MKRTKFEVPSMIVHRLDKTLINIRILSGSTERTIFDLPVMDKRIIVRTLNDYLVDSCF